MASHTDIHVDSGDHNSTPPPERKTQRYPTTNGTQSSLTKSILSRHSTRVFLPQIPPMDIIEECLEIAQHSPSSTNIQPWRLTFTAGPRLDKLKKAMMDTVTSGVKSTVPPIPDEYKHYRSAVGHMLYGPEGYNIPREDREGTKKAQLRNYDFFGAPMIATVGIDKSLLRGSDVMSVGLYVQTLVLLLTERGFGTCLEVSTSGFAQVIKKELDISDDITILCTLSVGYEDSTHNVNTFKMERDEYKEHVNFVMD